MSVPDPDSIFRNTVSSEIHNWDEFTVTPIQAHTGTSFQINFSGAQLLIPEVLQLSGLGPLKERDIARTGLLSPLLL